MAEAWYKEYCPHCDTCNWICNGDESDLSGVDIEGIKCRYCDMIFPLGEMPCNITDFSDINWEVGLETPQ